MDELHQVEPVDRLTGLVGLVTRASSTLEMALHELLPELGSEGDDWKHQKYENVDEVLNKCRARINAPAGLLPSREAPLAVLAAAGEAYRARNAVVHGVWHRVDVERLWSLRYRLKEGFVKIDFTEDELLRLAGRLTRVSVQTVALQHLVYDKIITDRRTEPDEDWDRTIRDSEALVRGEFDLVGLNHYRLHQPEAESGAF